MNYVFVHSPYLFYAYYILIKDEMQRHGYRTGLARYSKNYRGNTRPSYSNLAENRGQPDSPRAR
nr:MULTISPECIES: hypothetical protein [unclassified Eikenella]